jgi:predicted permease
MWASLVSDVRFASRQLAKAPGLTAVVVASLALGIGANATVLCWIQSAVRRPLLGVDRQEDLVVLVSNQGGGNVSLPDLRDFARLETVFVGAQASQITPASLAVDDRRDWVYGQIASANFFELLGVKPLLGRTFRPDEDRKPGGDPVLVISEGLWRRRFGADPGIVGRVVDLNRHGFTIIGVAPTPFRGTWASMAYDFWAPLSMCREVRNEGNLEDRDARGWHNLARLQPGVTVEQAQAAVATLDGQLAKSYPGTNRGTHHRVVPVSRCPYGAQAVMGPVLELLLAMSLGVLVIVGANVANLLLARGVGRRKEIAIRLAAGATRARLVRQLLTESLLLAMLGGAGGILLARWLVNLLRVFVPAVDLLPNVVLTYPLDGTTLGSTLVLTLTTGMLFGLMPALQASRADLHEALKEGGRSSSAGGAHHRVRSVLVASEIAVALVLLVGALLCWKGLQRARRIDFGLNPDRVLLADLQIGMNGYTEETGKVLYHRILESVAALPGVEEAALASWFPLGLTGCKGSGVLVEGYERPRGEDTIYEFAVVSSRYFAVLQIPMVAGRDFTEEDTPTTAKVAVVNEAFARRFWPGRDTLGRRFRARGEWRTVVGVARTGKYNRLDEPPQSFFYLPYQQYVPDLDLGIAVRTSGSPLALAKAVQQAVHDLDPGVDFLGTKSMTNHTRTVLFPEQVASNLLALLGTVGVILSAMGVYAVVAYAVGQRTQEFGVRIALGAGRTDVLGLVLRQGLALAVAGSGFGLLLALAVSRLLTSLLHGVSPFDPAALVGVPLGLALVAGLACYLPARRATRVDPMIALRSE